MKSQMAQNDFRGRACQFHRIQIQADLHQSQISCHPEKPNPRGTTHQEFRLQSHQSRLLQRGQQFRSLPIAACDTGPTTHPLQQPLQPRHPQTASKMYNLLHRLQNPAAVHENCHETSAESAEAQSPHQQPAAPGVRLLPPPCAGLSGAGSCPTQHPPLRLLPAEKSRAASEQISGPVCSRCAVPGQNPKQCLVRPQHHFLGCQIATQKTYPLRRSKRNGSCP
mmetsp:Transcript_106632/g.244124  ORF Transcript_106632/g.244124 Transcript_106632/m.244124 type:complete len:223 (-) Transcript_106632:952-1620(-)